MKTIHKFLTLGLLAAMSAGLFTSCAVDEFEATRETYPVNANSHKVYFPEQLEPIILGITDSEVEIPIARKIFTDALSVSIKIVADSGFTVPAEVSFGAGDSLTSFILSVGQIELVKKYVVTLEVDKNEADPYTAATPPVLSLDITKEDFAPYARGEYYSDWWEEDLGERILEYSPATNRYRIKAFCDYDGYDAYFEWDGGEEVTMVNGQTVVGSFKGFPTGYVHSSYGMIWAAYNTSNSFFEYDEATQTFAFGYFWGFPTSTGLSGWGVFADEFTITELY